MSFVCNVPNRGERGRGFRVSIKELKRFLFWRCNLSRAFAMLFRLLPNFVIRQAVIEAGFRKHKKDGQGIWFMTFDDLWEGLED